MKRRIAIVLLLLAGGAIVNVAVAWGLPLTLNNWHVDVVAVELEALAARIPNSRWFGPEVQPDGTLIMERRRIPLEDPAVRNLQRAWYSITVSMSSHSHSHTRSFQAGWPMLSMTGDVTGNPFAAPPGEPYVARLDHPILPGFIINTLFYALLLWLLLFAPGNAPRLLRRRRGLCEECAYPIGVNPVCTECGAAVVR